MFVAEISFISIFLTVEHKAFRHVGTEQIRQVFRMSLAFLRLSDGHKRVLGMYDDDFVKQNRSLSYFTAGVYT